MAMESDELLKQLRGNMTEDTGGKTKNDQVSRNHDDKYGCFVFKPSCLQIFNTIRWHVFWNCVFNFFEGFIVNGVINVIIPALEKRYGLTSSKSGAIASANDFGAVVLYMFVGYFGEQRHKPRIMACGIFLMSLGCFVFAIPQYVGELYEYTVSGANSSENLCLISSNTTSNTACVVQDDTSNEGYYACFLLGQILIGIGAVPMFTIGLTYIDENCNPKVTSFYIGQSFCAAAVGVAIGYIVGGQSLAYFVDINKVDPADVLLTPSDPQWVGAWWIGVLVGFAAFLLVGIPIFGYPQYLPGYDELQKKRKSEAYNNGTEQIMASANFGKSWRDFPRAFLSLVRNPTFIFLCLAGTTEALLVGGLATFGAKLLQEFYLIDLTLAGSIMGFITIPGAGGGMLLGGYIVKRMDLKCRGIIKMCAACMFICMFFAPSFLASCPSQPLAGVSHPYFSESEAELRGDCNRDCECTTAGFEPICDNNKTVYFSPCFAGCFHTTLVDGQKIYHNCSCIQESYDASLQSMTRSGTSGTCSEDCAWFYVFCVLLLLIMLLTFMTMSPGVTATFRCVPHKQRSMALGVELVIIRLLGTTPGPLLLGAILDSACDVWQVDQCGAYGSCWVYSKFDLGIRMLIWWASLKFLGVILYSLAAFLYKPPDDKVDFDDIQRNTIPTITSTVDAFRNDNSSTS